jgi:flagella basal body P-ring formation protein FlgA
MRCCAELSLLLLLAVPFSLGAQTSASSGSAAGASAQYATTGMAASQMEAVARRVAQHWRVDAAIVRIESTTPDAWPPANTPFTLLGDGADGTWIVAMEDSTGPRRRIVRAGTLQRVALAVRVLERGVTLGESDFAFDHQVRWGPPRRENEVVSAGWTTKRRINAGETLRAPLVQPPQAVRSGETVRLILERANLTLVLTGKAIGSAALGERLLVRAETGKRLEGVVVEPGVVRLERTGENR